MRITFTGAARTVTGSQYFLEVNGFRVLMECGLFQGRRADSLNRNRAFHVPPDRIDAVLLSHAHIDHSGNLPNLVKQGYHGPIYTTRATTSLSEVMLLDAGHIQEADAEFINKKRAKRGEPPIEPLYTQEDAAAVMPLLKPMDYYTGFEVVPGLVVEFFEAGHILGSAAIKLEIKESEKKKLFWFSGDIGRPGLPIVRDPILPSEVDYLMMECTYGDTHHDDPQQSHEKFGQVVKETMARGGKIIIPAFAVGRTQDLVFTLNQLISDKFIPPIPVYVDSPLAVQASKVFIKHPECYDAETHAFISEERHPALTFPGLTYIGSVEESKALNGKKGPMIIISASGMAETGRILHHLKNNIEDSRNTILIVSWQAPNTLGRRLVEKQPIVRIFGEEYPLRARVVNIGGLSAHAGQDMLIRYALSAKKSIKEIFLVHGEPDAAGILRSLLIDRGITNIHYPAENDSTEL